MLAQHLLAQSQLHQSQVLVAIVHVVLNAQLGHGQLPRAARRSAQQRSTAAHVRYEQPLAKSQRDDARRTAALLQLQLLQFVDDARLLVIRVAQSQSGNLIAQLHPPCEHVAQQREVSIVDGREGDAQSRAHVVVRRGWTETGLDEQLVHQLLHSVLGQLTAAVVAIDHDVDRHATIRVAVRSRQYCARNTYNTVNATSCRSCTFVAA